MNPTDKSVQKACLFNLIVYTGDRDSLESLQSSLDLIKVKFPCRIIYIQENRQDAHLELKLNFQKENQITIEGGTTHLSKIPFIILPYLIPDLPIYLFLKEDPTAENIILPFLKSISRRMIFDCELPENIALWSQKMLELLAQPSLEIVDMNWARTGGWRTVFTQVFDTQDRVANLSNCHSITLYYNQLSTEKKGRLDLQAVYLQSWLSSRLGWKFKSVTRTDSNLLFIYNIKGGDLSIEIKPAEMSNLPVAELTKIEITYRNNSQYTISRCGISQVEVHIETEDICYIPFKLPLISIFKKQKFITELFYKQPSDHYPLMVQEIGKYGIL